MDIDEIKRQFSAIGMGTSLSLAEVSTNLAQWMAQRANSLQAEDIALLCALGGAIHSAEMEQNWQRSWK